MKKLLFLLILFLSVSCTKTDKDGLFSYEIEVISSLHNEPVLIEYVNPNILDTPFEVVFNYNDLNNYWVFEDVYNEGDYLEIIVIGNPTIILQVNIFVNGKLVNSGPINNKITYN